MLTKAKPHPKNLRAAVQTLVGVLVDMCHLSTQQKKWVASIWHIFVCPVYNYNCRTVLYKPSIRT